MLKVLKDNIYYHSITDTKIGLLISGGREIYNKQIVNHSVKKNLNFMTVMHNKKMSYLPTVVPKITKTKFDKNIHLSLRKKIILKV